MNNKLCKIQLNLHKNLANAQTTEFQNVSTVKAFLPPCGVVKEMGLLLGPFPLRLKTLTVRLFSENGFSPGTMVWLLFPGMVRDCLSEGILLEVNRLWVCHQCTWEQETEERERGCWWGDIYIYGKETKSENRGRERKKAIRKHTVEYIKCYKQLVCCWMTISFCPAPQDLWTGGVGNSQCILQDGPSRRTGAPVTSWPSAA